MSPPYLSRNTPVPDIVQPFKIGRLPAGGHDLRFPLDHGRARHLRQRFYLDEPLPRNGRLDVCPAPVTLSDTVDIRFLADQESFPLKIPDDISPALEAILSLINTSPFIDHGIAVHDLDGFELVPCRNGKVIGIMGRGNLYRPGTELHAHIIVGNDRYPPADQGQDHLFPDFIPVSFIVRVNGNCRVTKHRFRSRRGHNKRYITICKRIPDMPEKPLFLSIFHFQVRNGGVTTGAPVYDIITLIYQTLAIQPDEDLPHCPG